MTDDNLDRTYGAIADPTRRRILELLHEREPLGTSDLSRLFPLTRWAVMKHVAVLREAGLVQTLPQGRRRLHFIDQRRLAAARGWLEPFA